MPQPKSFGIARGYKLGGGLKVIVPPPTGEPVPPLILSSSTFSVLENTALEIALVANEPCTWAKVGGADQALYGLVGSTLTLPAKDFESPLDAGADNTYVVQIVATSIASGLVSATHPITSTVTNVAEGGGSYLTVAPNAPSDPS